MKSMLQALGFKTITPYEFRVAAQFGDAKVVKNYLQQFSDEAKQFAAVNACDPVSTNTYATSHSELDNNPALVLAAGEGHYDVVELLIYEGRALVNLRSSQGNTPLIAAIDNKHTDIAARLLYWTANVECTNRNNQTALMFAHQPRDVDLLLRFSAVVNTQDGHGETALFYAIRNGHPDVVQRLLENNANLYHMNSDDETALMFLDRCRLKPAIRNSIKQILINFDYFHKKHVNALEARLKDKVENIPDAFICPITQQIIQDPVYLPEANLPKDAAANHAFERVALVKWLEDPDPQIKSTHPLTKKPVTISDIRSHTALKQEIENFVSEVENNYSKNANNAPEEKKSAAPSPMDVMRAARIARFASPKNS